jgi:hypothetical protein
MMATFLHLSNFRPVDGISAMGDSAPTNDRGQFLRLFLEAERDIHRYICAIGVETVCRAAFNSNEFLFRP